MLNDLWKVIKSTYYFAIREWKRRASIRNRVVEDPFTPALENTIRRVINEGREQ